MVTIRNERSIAMGRYPRMLLVGSALLGLTAMATQNAWSGTYSFTEIARANTGLGPGIDFADILAYGVDPGVPVNSEGVVAFRAAENNIVNGVYYGSGGAITQVADNDAGSSLTGFHGLPSINSSNQVAFKASMDATTTGIFRGDGGALTTIATTSPGGFGGLSEKPSINASGNVAFLTSPSGIYVGAGGMLTPIYVSGDGKGVEPVSDAVLNDAGEVAFGGRALGVDGIHRGSGGAVTTIVDLSGGFFTGIGDASMTGSSDSVAWWSYTATGQGIFRGTGGAAMTVADNLGPYGEFSINGDPAASAAGTAFFATLDEGGYGLFTGADPVADKVIQVGDSLLGSTVAGLVPLARSSMNDLGQIGFVAYLANGDLVVARANPLSAPLPLPDYNGNDVVDGPDYVVWRDTLDQTGWGLAADGNSNGAIDPGDYDAWRTHFGVSAGGGTSLMTPSSATVVPEPVSAALLVMGVALAGRIRRRSA
jgi:hypothetical protein